MGLACRLPPKMFQGICCCDRVWELVPVSDCSGEGVPVNLTGGSLLVSNLWPPRVHQNQTMFFLPLSLLDQMSGIILACYSQNTKKTVYIGGLEVGDNLGFSQHFCKIFRILVSHVQICKFQFHKIINIKYGKIESFIHFYTQHQKETRYFLNDQKFIKPTYCPKMAVWPYCPTRVNPGFMGWVYQGRVI